MDATPPLTLQILGNLTEEEKAHIEEIRKQIDVSSGASVLQYGAEIQGRISGFADKVLAEVKARDTGFVGQLLTDLMLRINEMRVDRLPGKPAGILSRIPFLGSLADGTRRFLTRFQSVSGQIVRIVEELEKAKIRLQEDVGTLDRLYQSNMEYFRGIGLFIMAGEAKLRELNEVLLPEKKARAESSGDPMEHQQYKDLVNFAGRLEKKIHDLKLSRTLSLHTAPQIRLVQAGNQELSEKIQSSILNTIPLWKQQMAIAITLLRQSQMLGLHKEVSGTTRELLEKNAEMLRIGTVEIAKEAEKGIVDIETLKKVNAQLIGTIDETIKLHQEGKIRREEAEREIERLEKELKEKLVEMKSR